MRTISALAALVAVAAGFLPDDSVSLVQQLVDKDDVAAPSQGSHKWWPFNVWLKHKKVTKEGAPNATKAAAPRAAHPSMELRADGLHTAMPEPPGLLTPEMAKLFPDTGRRVGKSGQEQFSGTELAKTSKTKRRRKQADGTIRKRATLEDETPADKEKVRAKRHGELEEEQQGDGEKAQLSRRHKKANGDAAEQKPQRRKKPAALKDEDVVDEKTRSGKEMEKVRAKRHARLEEAVPEDREKAQKRRRQGKAEDDAAEEKPRNRKVHATLEDEVEQEAPEEKKAPKPKMSKAERLEERERAKEEQQARSKARHETDAKQRALNQENRRKEREDKLAKQEAEKEAARKAAAAVPVRNATKEALKARWEKKKAQMAAAKRRADKEANMTAEQKARLEAEKGMKQEKVLKEAAKVERNRRYQLKMMARTRSS